MCLRMPLLPARTVTDPVESASTARLRYVSDDVAGISRRQAGKGFRGRKQYRYHPRWRQARDETKYHRILSFAAALPRIRKAVRRDLRRRGLPREKVLATVVRLMEMTLIRVGNEEYARANNSYGLTTLLDRHVHVKGPQVRFRFRGKAGKQHEVDVYDRRLAKIVKKCRDLPGQELFAYIDDDGETCDVSSDD